MNDRVKKTKRKVDPSQLPDVPFEFVKSSQGGQSVKYKGSNEDFIRYLIRQFHFEPNDMYINGNKEVCIKKTGRYRWALANGFCGSRIVKEEYNVKLGYAKVVVQVFKKGIEKPFEDVGFCARDERSNSPFSHIILTATTRGLIRATQQIAPLQINYEELEGDDSEVDAVKIKQTLQPKIKCPDCGVITVFKQGKSGLFCPECFSGVDK